MMTLETTYVLQWYLDPLGVGGHTGVDLISAVGLT